eukprot:2231827-Rhodomonas_salina.4
MHRSTAAIDGDIPSTRLIMLLGSLVSSGFHSERLSRYAASTYSDVNLTSAVTISRNAAGFPFAFGCELQKAT